jgi:hypothetical protein
MGGKSGKAQSAEAARARAEEEARQQRIRQGTSDINSKFSQFDDTFYRGIRDSYTNYALPQLTEQRDKAAKDLTFSLARSGQLDGSVRAQKTGELQKLFDLNEQQVRDQALAQENQARNNVENARADLVGTLNATGDNQQAVNSALSRATVLTQPQAYSPLGQLFTDFTAELGSQAARERAAAASGGRYAPTINTGLFGGQGQVVTRY